MFKQSLKWRRYLWAVHSLHPSCPFRWRLWSDSGPRSMSPVHRQVVLRSWGQRLCPVLVRRLPGKCKQLWDWSPLQEFLRLHVTDCLEKRVCANKLTSSISVTEEQIGLMTKALLFDQLLLGWSRWWGALHCLSGYIHTAGAPIQFWTVAHVSRMSFGTTSHNRTRNKLWDWKNETESLYLILCYVQTANAFFYWMVIFFWKTFITSYLEWCPVMQTV